MGSILSRKKPSDNPGTVHYWASASDCYLSQVPVTMGRRELLLVPCDIPAIREGSSRRTEEHGEQQARVDQEPHLHPENEPR